MLLQACAQARGLGCARRGSCIHNDIHRGKLLLMQSKRFANDPLDAIASDRIADGLGRNGEAQASYGFLVRPHDEPKHRISVAATLFIRVIEV